MKLLWLTGTPPGASNIVNDSAHVKGWISSLAELIKTNNDSELAIAFFGNSKNKSKFVKDEITYYPIEDKLSTRIGQIKTRFIGKLWDSNLPELLRIIDEFKPDVIQIFGTESGMGEIVSHTHIPSIIHIQGLINPYLFNWLPRGITLQSIFFKSKLRELAVGRDMISDYKVLKKKALREENIIKNTRYFFGRTAWDKQIVQLINPEIIYFHCDEVLRPFIYESSGQWKNNSTGVLKLVTTINPEIYKGLDIILETAQILKEKTSLDFEWNIIGVSQNNRIVKMMEKNKAYRFKNFPINFLGVKKSEELISELLRCSLFIHPSHVDNSPNSVCEAMILGMPVVAGYVGGIPSLIEHKFNGFLYNSNSPYDLAALIVEISGNSAELERIGKNANCTAMKRHDPATIVETLKDVYKVMLSNNNKTVNKVKINA